MTSLYDVDKFDPPPDQELICCICTCVLDSAVESQCRHVFCKYCIETWLRQHRTCPTCRKKVSQRQLKPILPLVQNMLNKLTMICDFKENGCHVKPILEHYRSHVAKCSYEKVKCQFSKCPSVLLRRDLEEHERQLCEFREVLCQQQCGLQIPFKDVESHDCIQALKDHAEERNKHAQELEKRLQELITVQEHLRRDVEELRQRVEREQPSSLDIDESTTSSWDFFDDDEDQNTTVFLESDSDNDVLAGDSSLLASTSDNESDGPEMVQPIDVNSGIQESVIASTSNEPGTSEDQAVLGFVNEGEDTVNGTDGEGMGSSGNHLPLGSQRKMAIHDLIDNIISYNIESTNQQPFQQSSDSVPISSGATTASDQTSLGSHHSQAGRSPLHCPTDQLVVTEMVKSGDNARIPTLALSHGNPQTNTMASLFGSGSYFGATTSEVTTSEVFNENGSLNNLVPWPVIDSFSSRYPSRITDLSGMVLPGTSTNSNLLQITSDSTGLLPLTLDVTSNSSDFLHRPDSCKSTFTSRRSGDRVSSTMKTGDRVSSTMRTGDRVSSTREHGYSTRCRSSSSSRSVFASATITSAQLEGGHGNTDGSGDPWINISSMDAEDVIECGGQRRSDEDSSVTAASKKRHNNDLPESTEPVLKNRRQDLSVNFSDEMVDQRIPNVNVNINLALLDITEFADPPVAVTDMLAPTLQDSFKSGRNPVTSSAVISNQRASVYSRTAGTCIVNPDASLLNLNCHRDAAPSRTSKCLNTLHPQHNNYAINVTRLDQTTAAASLECQRPRLPSATSEQHRPSSPSATSEHHRTKSPPITSEQHRLRSPSSTSEQCNLRSLSAMALLGWQRRRSSLSADLVEDVSVPPSMSQLLSMCNESDSSWNPDRSDQDASDESSLANDGEVMKFWFPSNCHR